MSSYIDGVAFAHRLLNAFWAASIWAGERLGNFCSDFFVEFKTSALALSATFDEARCTTGLPLELISSEMLLEISSLSIFKSVSMRSIFKSTQENSSRSLTKELYPYRCLV